VKFHSLRSILAGLTTLGAALLLSACGGSGAGGNPNQGGPITISPSSGTFYAGVPSTMTVAGGRKPYAITSSEPGILPVPDIVNTNSFQVIPNNPGVVDINTDPLALPVRSITISARDSTGILVQAIILVARNFLTGYGLNLSPVTCPAPATGAAATACAGGTTAARMQAIFNGSLTGNRLFRYKVISGQFTLKDPETGLSCSTLPNPPCTITLRSDHDGNVLGYIVVAAGVGTQLAVIRVEDVLTGVYADQVFTITSGAANQGRLVTIPTTMTFTGPTTLVCGTGSADILIFDGSPPYTAVSTNPNIIIANSPSNTQPGRITIQAINPSVCLTATIVIQDATGARASVTVITEAGTTVPAAPPALTVAPTSITLATCGQSGSVSVVGGTGNYSVNSTDPRVTATVGGNTLTVTRAGTAQVAPFTTFVTTITVTDGASIKTLDVTSPTACI
jgi:hypothetical protein